MRVLFTALAISTFSFLAGVAGDLSVPARPTTRIAEAAVARISLPAAPAFSMVEPAPLMLAEIEMVEPLAPVEASAAKLVLAGGPDDLTKPGRAVAELSKL